MLDEMRNGLLMVIGTKLLGWKSIIVEVQEGVLDDHARVYDGLFLAGCAAVILGDSHRCMPSFEIETKIKNKYRDYARILCYSKSTSTEYCRKGT
jgi:hypothetical protein